MYLGLDVGGTHTDAVLVNEKGVAASVKVVTDRDNLLNSVNAAIEELLARAGAVEITRINLSTTLSTNAIIEGKTEEVGTLVSAGPGIDAARFEIGRNFHIIDGSVDHRGTEIKGPDRRQVEKAIEDCRKSGIKVFAVAAKFSTRNPSHENLLKDLLGQNADFVTPGHRLSGQLNFPRRITTAYFNSAVWRIFNGFADAVEKGLGSFGKTAQVNILKADGGTMPLAMAKQVPVESILSGPAASVMGIVALCDIREDSVILDIGGTTTDIAVFADGAPLIEPEGISLEGRPTLVRALKTKSIGLGGDSLLGVKGGAVTVGPERKGPPMADGGSEPALLDAFNVAGKTEYRDRAASERGIASLAGKAGMGTAEFAAAALRCAIDTIQKEIGLLIEEINEKPVYTVHEMLEGKTVTPRALYVMGGPAGAFADMLSEAFSLPVAVPDNYAVANAIGAALARTTIEIELFADTERRKLVIPGIDVNTSCEREYSLVQARQDAVAYLMDHFKTLGVDSREGEAEIVEASSFNMVGGFYTTGKNIRVKCQIKPGVLFKLNGGGKS